MIYQHQLSALVLDHLHDIYMCLRRAFEPVYQSLLASCLSMPMTFLPTGLPHLCYEMCYSCGCCIVEAWFFKLLCCLCSYIFCVLFVLSSEDQAFEPVE
jgi:hypothetical protein